MREEGLKDLSRGPKESSFRTAAEIEKKVLKIYKESRASYFIRPGRPTRKIEPINSSKY